CGYLSAARIMATRGVYGLNLVQLNPYTLPEAPELDRLGWWPPLYSLVIAVAAGRGLMDAAHLVATAGNLDLAGMLVAAAGLVALITVASGSLPVGLLGGGLCILSGPFLSEVPRVLSEHVYLPLAVWAAVLHLLAVKRGGWRLALGAGTLWGLACLTRHWGVAAAVCAGGAAWMVLRGQGWRRWLPSVLLAPGMGVACWAAWTARCLAVTGHSGGFYGTGRGDFGKQLLISLRCYLSNFCWNPSAGSAIRGLQGLTALQGMVILAVSVIVTVVMYRRLRGDPETTGLRWLLVLAVGCTLAAVLGLAFYRSAKWINHPGGRMMMEACVMTIAALVAAAARLPALRPPVALLGLCILLGGALQGTSNLLLPTPQERIADIAVLGGDERLQELVRGRRILLMARDGVRPSADLVGASVYLPTASTVYWVDNERYAGISVGAPELTSLIRRAPVDYVLAGPVYRPLIPRQPPAGDSLLDRMRAGSWGFFLKMDEGEFEILHEKLQPLPVATREVARVGEWRLLQVIPPANPTQDPPNPGEGRKQRAGE
ncbi:hypothetical protein LLH03_01330, partial [bacterium]|nr:hypothetical protein [bacterium]